MTKLRQAIISRANYFGVKPSQIAAVLASEGCDEARLREMDIMTAYALLGRAARIARRALRKEG
jgi:hypothetical protein